MSNVVQLSPAFAKLITGTPPGPLTLIKNERGKTYNQAISISIKGKDGVLVNHTSMSSSKHCASQSSYDSELAVAVEASLTLAIIG